MLIPSSLANINMQTSVCWETGYLKSLKWLTQDIDREPKWPDFCVTFVQCPWTRPQQGVGLQSFRMCHIWFAEWWSCFFLHLWLHTEDFKFYHNFYEGFFFSKLDSFQENTSSLRPFVVSFSFKLMNSKKWVGINLHVKQVTRFNDKWKKRKTIIVSWTLDT